MNIYGNEKSWKCISHSYNLQDRVGKKRMQIAHNIFPENRILEKADKLD